MLRFICTRLIYISTAVPLPVFVLAILFTMLADATEITIITGIASLLLLIAALSYLLSLLLAVICGLARRFKALLFPALLAMLDIALFVVFLPEDETAVGWRFIDYLLIGGLVVLNLIQWFVLRRETKINRISGDDDDFEI